MNVDAVKSISTCCDKCKDICFSIDGKIISDSIYAGKVTLSNNSLRKNDFLINGYAKGILCKDKEHELLRNIELLDKYRSLYKISDIQKCLCDNDIQKLVDNILGIADISCCSDEDRADVVIDDSAYNEWVIKNPNCVVYESWEAAFLGVCTEFSIEKIFLQQDPKLLYELNVANIDNKCDLILAINIQNQICSPVLADIKVTKEETCKLEYEILIKEKNCNIEFDTYVKLIDCGIKAEVISKLLDCGLNIDYNAEKKSCDVFLDSDIKITLCDYKFNFDINETSCAIASDIFGVQLCV